MAATRHQLRSHIIPIVAVLAVQTAIAVLSFGLLSTVRAYVAGESQWSKAQKDAVHNVRLFLRTGEEDVHRAYERAIAVPLSDKRARLALEVEPISVERSSQGFLGGGNHPDDIPGMIMAFRYFRSVSYMAKAVDSWRKTDPYLEELVRLGDAASALSLAGKLGTPEALALDSRIKRLDRELAPHADAFSAALGEASRALTLILVSFNGVTALLLVVLVVLNSSRLLAHGARFEKALMEERQAAIEKGQLLQGVVHNFPGGITFTDANMRLTLVNEQGRKLLEFPDSLFAGEPPTLEDVFRFNAVRGEYGPGDVEELVASRMALARQRRPHVFERKRPDGTVIEVRGAPLESGGFVTTYTDVTERCAAEAKILHMAYHDRLTGLGNRTQLGERVEQAIAQSRTGQLCALHLIDLDHFKSVNDAQGHLSGDAVLRAAAQRLTGLVRSSDSVVRMGGDEFAVLQTNIVGRDCAAALAEGIVDKLSQVYDVEGRQLHLGASVGVAMLPADGFTLNEAMRHADLALYASKAMGRSRFSFFEPSLSTNALARMEIRDELRLAISEGELAVHYQPIVEISTSKILAREALVRWKHRTKGYISPAKFITIAEEYGLIQAISAFVLRTALRDSLRWTDGARVAVNLSPAQFRSGDVVRSVLDALEETGQSASSLELEITESVLLDATAGSLASLQQLRGLGVKIALDDFGTGYSSLSYLARFPLDKLKIDRSFVAAMEDDGRSMAIVSAVAHLGKNLGLLLTAEGIETPEQLAMITAAGFDCAQGFLFGRPEACHSSDDSCRQRTAAC